MRRLEVYIHGQPAGIFTEAGEGKLYTFEYADGYNGPPISLTMPVREKKFEYDHFPSFFDGLLPEGRMLDSLLRQKKIDKYDYFGQLEAVGEDMVGAVTVYRMNPNDNNNEA